MTPIEASPGVTVHRGVHADDPEGRVLWIAVRTDHGQCDVYLTPDLARALATALIHATEGGDDDSDDCFAAPLSHFRPARRRA